MSTRTFTRAQLEELDVSPWTPLASWVVAERRWDIVRALVFEADGKFWQVEYVDPATEMQDSDPWDYLDTITATQVHEVEKTVKRWEPVDVPG